MSLQDDNCKGAVEKGIEEKGEVSRQLVLDDITGELITEEERRHKRKYLAQLAKRNSTSVQNVIINRRQYYSVQRCRYRQDQRRKLLLMRDRICRQTVRVADGA